MPTAFATISIPNRRRDFYPNESDEGLTAESGGKAVGETGSWRCPEASIGPDAAGLRQPGRPTRGAEQGGNRVFKPGNEFLIQAGGGFRPFVDWLAVVLNVDTLLGTDGEDRTRKVVLQTPRREIIELQPGLLFQPGLGFSIQAGAGIPVYGRNYPAGPRFLTSIQRSFDLWD